jgi:hypothetical protein
MVTGTHKSYSITGELPRNSAGTTPAMVSVWRLTRMVFPTIADRNGSSCATDAR